MSKRNERIIARFLRVSSLQILDEMKTLYDRAELGSLLTAQCLEKVVCERNGVKYNFAHHNLIFTAYYLGEIDAITVLEGIPE